jgi:hypothetical protein
MEYAKMLYANPRGIGCNKCHGNTGKGSVIAHYKVKGAKITLRAPAINDIKKEKFFKALKKTHKVMPTYFLTDTEIDILYFFVTSEVGKK